jgi:iron-sulfur cluster assembly accessory protein
MQPVIETGTLSVSSSAIEAIRDLLKERDLKNYALRIVVSGKTCSGYQYGMSLDDSIGDSDVKVEMGGINIVVDNMSMEYLKGANLDFIDDERGKGFMINNPNVSSSCSCDDGGSSCCS